MVIGCSEVQYSLVVKCIYTIIVYRIGKQAFEKLNKAAGLYKWGTRTIKPVEHPTTSAELCLAELSYLFKCGIFFLNCKGLGRACESRSN